MPRKSKRKGGREKIIQLLGQKKKKSVLKILKNRRLGKDKG